MVKSPLHYVGGKSALATRLISMFPPHTRYVEPFGGAAHVLLQKHKVAEEVYADKNEDLVNFFAVLGGKDETYREFLRLCSLTPNSREEVLRIVQRIQVEDTAAWAQRFFVAQHYSFGGAIEKKCWGFHASVPSLSHSFFSKLAQLYKVRLRLIDTQMLAEGWEDTLGKFDSPTTLFYCDPPYVHEAQRGGIRYDYDMTDEDHKRLVSSLLQLQGKVVLSGYPNAIYSRLEKLGWTTHEFTQTCMAAGRVKGSQLQGVRGSAIATQQRIEKVWMSPSCFG